MILRAFSARLQTYLVRFSVTSHGQTGDSNFLSTTWKNSIASPTQCTLPPRSLPRANNRGHAHWSAKSEPRLSLFSGLYPNPASTSPPLAETASGILSTHLPHASLSAMQRILGILLSSMKDRVIAAAIRLVRKSRPEYGRLRLQRGEVEHQDLIYRGMQKAHRILQRSWKNALVYQGKRALLVFRMERLHLLSQRDSRAVCQSSRTARTSTMDLIKFFKVALKSAIVILQRPELFDRPIVT